MSSRRNMSHTIWLHQVQALVITAVITMTIEKSETPAEVEVNQKCMPDRCDIPSYGQSIQRYQVHEVGIQLL